jgi:hypothetical protein
VELRVAKCSRRAVPKSTSCSNVDVGRNIARQAGIAEAYDLTLTAAGRHRVQLESQS